MSIAKNFVARDKECEGWPVAPLPPYRRYLGMKIYSRRGVLLYDVPPNWLYYEKQGPVIGYVVKCWSKPYSSDFNKVMVMGNGK